MGDRFCQIRQVKKSSRKNTVYDLSFVQQPRCARTVGSSHKIDRSPINPAPVIQLNVIDPSGSPKSKKQNSFQSDIMVGENIALGSDQKEKGKTKKESGSRSESQSFLQNPYYFMNATLTNATPDAKTGIYKDLHSSKDGKTKFLVGSTVSSLYHLQIQLQKDVGVFVFPDLSIRQEGEYRVRFDLYEILGKEIHVCRSILSEAFQVCSPKQPLVTDQRVEDIQNPIGPGSTPRTRNTILTVNKLSKPTRQRGNSRASVNRRLIGGVDHDEDRLPSDLSRTRDRRRSASPNEQGMAKRLRVAEIETEKHQKEPQMVHSMAVHDESHASAARGSAGVRTNSHGTSPDVAPQRHIRTPLFPSSTSLSHMSSSRSPHQSDNSFSHQSSSYPIKVSQEPAPPNEHSSRPISHSYKSIGSALVGEYTSASSAPQAYPPSDSSNPPFYRDHRSRDQSSNIILPPIHFRQIRRPSSPPSTASSTPSHSFYHQPLFPRSASNEKTPDERQSSNVKYQSPIGWSSRTTNSSLSRRFSISSSSTSLGRSSSYGSTISSTFSPVIGNTREGSVVERGESHSANSSRPNTRTRIRTVDSSMAPPDFIKLDNLSRPRSHPSGARISIDSPIVADRKHLECGPTDMITGLGKVSSTAAVSTSASSSTLSPMESGERKPFPGLGLKEMLNPSSEEEENNTSLYRRQPPCEDLHDDLSAPSDSTVAPSFSASRIGLYNLLS